MRTVKCQDKLALKYKYLFVSCYFEVSRVGGSCCQIAFAWRLESRFALGQHGAGSGTDHRLGEFYHYRPYMYIRKDHLRSMFQGCCPVVYFSWRLLVCV